MFKVKKDYIEINDLSQFNIDQILESGQIFSYEKMRDYYLVLSGNKCAKVKKENSVVKIFTSDIDYFINFFDLKSDYNVYKKIILENFPQFVQILNYGYGIRMLKQDMVEMFVSWAISANNNIKRIKKSIKYLRKNAGENMGEFYSFPTLDKLKQLDEKFFIAAGCGYRASQLVRLIDALDFQKLKDYYYLETSVLKNELLKYCGIGSKVADCILMSVYDKKDVFPVDTWIEKVYHQYFNENEKDRKKMRENLVHTFQNLSAYIQQLFFYFKRFTN